jgi:hypothetical protein
MRTGVELCGAGTQVKVNDVRKARQRINRKPLFSAVWDRPTGGRPSIGCPIACGALGWTAPSLTAARQMRPRMYNWQYAMPFSLVPTDARFVIEVSPSLRLWVPLWCDYQFKIENIRCKKIQTYGRILRLFCRPGASLSASEIARRARRLCVEQYAATRVGAICGLN